MENMSWARIIFLARVQSRHGAQIVRAGRALPLQPDRRRAIRAAVAPHLRGRHRPGAELRTAGRRRQPLVRLARRRGDAGPASPSGGVVRRPPGVAAPLQPGAGAAAVRWQRRDHRPGQRAVSCRSRGVLRRAAQYIGRRGTLD